MMFKLVVRTFILQHRSQRFYIVRWSDKIIFRAVSN